MATRKPAIRDVLILPIAGDRIDVPNLSRRSSGRRAERDVGLVGRAALLLDPANILDSMDAVLDLVRSATGADCAELFLLDPAGEQLFLTLERGPDADAFMDQDRFPVASGFPGLAVKRGRSVYTDHLPDDDRFLRAGVKAAGYQSFLSVPVSASRRVLGTINLGWKRGDVDFERAGRLLGWLGRPVGNALLASARMWSEQWRSGDVGLHEHLAARTGAGRVTLVRLGALADGEVDRKLDGDGPWDRQFTDCPPVRGAGLRVLSRGAEGLPRLCLQRCGSSKTRYCLPLEQAGELRGILRLDYLEHEPGPATRHLVASLGTVAACLAEPPPQLDLSPPALKPPVPPLEIRCFGTFEVLIDGEPLPRSAFARKKALDLLRLLALKPGRAVAGSQLARLLWPGVEPEAGRNRLHGVVYALRKGLEPNKERSAPSWIGCEDDRYSLDAPPGTRVDLWRFRSGMARARAAAGTGEPTEVVVARLEEAVELYRGELFAGVEDAIWTIDPRSRCREQCIDALLRLHSCRTGLGADKGDVSLLRRVLVMDPLREDVHLRLIRSLLDAERRGDALAQYRSLARVLRDELDASPSPAAQRLRREMCDG